METNENRVYGKKIDINTNHTIDFYDKRAKTIAEREYKYTTVLLGDQNPDYARRWNDFEKKFVLPKLEISSEKNVLDIGCGMGRWAETLVPICKEYMGVDFSSEMIKVARESFHANNCHFVNASFQEAVKNEEILKYKYDAVIIAGVSMYINEDDLRNCYNELTDCLNQNAIIYIEESVGVNERLTLNHIWSEGLQDNYDAVYRTAEEYRELMDMMIEKCDVIESGYLNELDKKELSETSHWYILLRKK